MKSRLKLLTLIFFLISLASLIIVDWYYKGYGIFIMFLFLTLALIIDQFRRIIYPDIKYKNQKHFLKNRLINIISLILYIQSPVVLIYGNRYKNKLGLFTSIFMITIAISLSYFASLYYPYKE